MAFLLTCPIDRLLPRNDLLKFDFLQDDDIFHAGMTICAVCWILTYAATIKLGFERQTYGIPFIALVGNVAWEFIYSFIKTGRQTRLQTNLNMITFALDMVNVYLFLRFGRQATRSGMKMSRAQFYVGSVSVFVAAFLILITMDNVYICTWWQNLVMSISFLMFLATRVAEDQSRAAAYLKMIGTFVGGVVSISYRAHLFTTVAEYKHFVALVYGTAFLDVVYIWMLEAENDVVEKKGREEGKKNVLVNWMKLYSWLISIVAFVVSGIGFSKNRAEGEIVKYEIAAYSVSGNATRSDVDNVNNICTIL